MRIAVVGLGYVGLVTATCLARLGQDVIGLEADESKVATLEAGDVPYYEPHLESELNDQRASGRVRFTSKSPTALGDADVVLICVGTPSDPTGHADLRFVFQAADAVARHASGSPVVVLRSTVPVGTTRKVEDRLNVTRADLGRHERVSVLANPEFLRTGRAIEDFLRPTRIVIGRTELATSEDVDRLTALYAPLEAPVVLTDAASAELIKNASNTFLAMRITYANELAALCDATGASIDDVIRGMSFDPRIGGQFFRPGLGFGGSCLPKDVRSLISMGSDHHVEMELARAVDAVNSAQAGAHVLRLEALLGRAVAGLRVAVLGLAFKPDTDDVRESPALALVRALRDSGATPIACDPQAEGRVAALEPWLELAPDPVTAATGADAVVLATEWPAYVTIDLKALAAVMAGRAFLDARNAFDPAAVEAAGLQYAGVGRGTRGAGHPAGSAT